MKFDPYKFETVTISGVPVFFKNVPTADGFVHIRVIIKVGARHDPEGKEGLAHFLEHMPFNGCKDFPTREKVEGFSRRVFMDTLNANTKMERTCFECKAATGDLAEAFSFLSRFVFCPVIDENEVERERRVILQEIWRRYENELAERLDKEVERLKYGTHPFHRMGSACGWHDAVSTVTRADLLAFHREHYVSGNLAVIFVGDIDSDKVLATVPIVVGSCPEGAPESLPAKVKVWPNPLVSELRRSAREYYGFTAGSIPKSTRVAVSRMFPIQDNYMVPVLLRKLVYRMLFDRIRGELGAVYTPRIGGDTSLDHMSATVNLEIDPSQLESTRRIVKESVAEIAAGGVQCEILFQEIVSAHLKKMKLSDESAGDIADEVITDVVTKGKITTLEEDLINGERVSYEDVARLARDEFKPEQLFWFIMTP